MDYMVITISQYNEYVNGKYDIFDNEENKSSNNINSNEDNHQLNLSIEKLNEFDNFFKGRIIGQDSALNYVKSQLINLAYEIDLNGNKNSRPAGIFFLVGPSGVGKTEMCKSLNEFLYNNQNINRFDMSEYKSDEWSMNKLIGAPNGLIGYEEGGTLTNAMIRNPNSIVLFDEIEKVHVKVLDIFLQILDDGVVTSSKGEKILFKNNIIIFTSNLGASRITPWMSKKEIDVLIKEEINNFFTYEINRPEILGRIGADNIISFNTITKKQDTYKILDIYFDEFIESYNAKKIKLIFNKNEVYDEILSKVDVTKGARDIRNNFDFFKKQFTKSLFEHKRIISKLMNNTLEFSYQNRQIILKIN